jgi:zinc protease
MAYHVAGGVDVELTADKVVQEIQKIRRSGPGNVLPRLQRDTRFVLPRLGAPTAVVEEQDLPEINARLLRFGNNVRLNFVASQQEPGLVRAVVRIGAGLLEMPGNKPALKEFGLNTVLASGSVHFRPQLLSALIQEHLLEFSFDIDDRDAFTFRGVMSAEHLEVFFGLIADILQAPKFNSYVHKDEKLRAAMGRASETIGMQDGLRALTDHLFAGDARFTWGSPLDYVSMSVLDVRRWMEAALKGGYLEATVVGDLTEAQAVATTSRTLGALEPRAATKVVATKPAPVKLTAPAGSTRIEFVGEQNVGLVVGTWPVSERMHMRDQAALEVLAKVLELRVRAEMREKLGLAYSPSAEFEPYDGFSGFAVLQAQIDCAPNDTSKVSPLIPTIGARLATEGLGEGEFIGARGILRSRLRQSFHENGFLSLMLMRAQERPAVVEEIVALRQGLMDKITRDEVNAWAGKILPADNCRTAEIVPKPFVGIFEVGR